MVSFRTVLSIALLGLVLSNVGCSNLLWNLQPYRMQRLNRGSAPSLDPEFSYRSLKSEHRMANQASPSDTATVSGNSANVAIVRAQSPE